MRYYLVQVRQHNEWIDAYHLSMDRANFRRFMDYLSGKIEVPPFALRPQKFDVRVKRCEPPPKRYYLFTGKRMEMIDDCSTA